METKYSEFKLMKSEYTNKYGEQFLYNNEVVFGDTYKTGIMPPTPFKYINIQDLKKSSVFMQFNDYLFNIDLDFDFESKMVDLRDIYQGNFYPKRAGVIYNILNYLVIPIYYKFGWIHSFCIYNYDNKQRTILPIVITNKNSQQNNFMFNNTNLYVITGTNTITMYDITTGQVVKKFNNDSYVNLAEILYSTNEYLVAILDNYHMTIWDIKSGAIINTYDLDINTNGRKNPKKSSTTRGINIVSYMYKHFILIATKNRIEIINIFNGKIVETLKNTKGKCDYSIITNDNYILIGCKTDTILYDLDNFEKTEYKYTINNIEYFSGLITNQNNIINKMHSFTRDVYITPITIFPGEYKKIKPVMETYFGSDYLQLEIEKYFNIPRYDELGELQIV